MRPLAFTYCYNEADILPHTLRRMRDSGCDLYVLDNWSTDGTRRAVIDGFVGRGLVACELFPAERPPEWFDLDAILRRIEAVHDGLVHGWALLFGADEVLEAPWPGVSLAAGLERVAAEGYNAIDFATACFHPVDDSWTPADDPVSYFRYWTRGRYQGNLRAWNSTGAIRFLHGGHDMAFDGRRVYPTRFILRHYPFRTQAQAERKVFVERRPRYAPANRAKGWHMHLDHIRPGHRFIQEPAGLREYDPATFYSEVLACPIS